MSSLSTIVETQISAEALERYELQVLPDCPFSLPMGDDLSFLLAQKSTTSASKDISFDPSNGRLSGLSRQGQEARTRLAEILGRFSSGVRHWLQNSIPEYAAGLTSDRVSLRSREEATRVSRLRARNDLLHIDHFPTRPSFGRRILRVYVNIDPTDAHVWSVSERFPELLARLAARNRISARSIEQWTSPTQSMVRQFTGKKPNRTAYDALMVRLHDFLKENQGFQMKAVRKVHTFQPGATWALFADGLAHAQLRGRFALEHSFFVDLDCLVNPDASPLALLQANSSSQSRFAA